MKFYKWKYDKVISLCQFERRLSIELLQMAQNCLVMNVQFVVDVMAANMLVLLKFPDNFVNIFRNLSITKRSIFHIEISRAKTTGIF